MAEVVHAQAVIDSPVVSNDVALTTRLTLNAAALSAAGFVNSDEVIVLFFAVLHDANILTDQTWRLQYNAATITCAAADPFIASANATNLGRGISYMTRLNLGTLNDFIFQTARVNTSANTTVQTARLVILKASGANSLGTENTDWFWNKSTTNVAHTTTYSATNRAAVTWTPASATDDWLVLASDHMAIDQITLGNQARVMLDGATLVAGGYYEEGETLTEEITHLMGGIIENLSVASHTVALESRDSAATAANDHRESAILVVRAQKFPDMFWDTPVDNATAASTSEQVAGITASLSEAQDALLLAFQRTDVAGADNANWMWLADNGTPINPNTSGGSNARAMSPGFDVLDEIQSTWLGISARSTGAQDLEMWTHTFAACIAEEITLVLWGLELGAAPPPASILLRPDPGRYLLIR